MLNPTDKDPPASLLDLSEEDILPWRGQPISRLLLAHLESEREKTRSAICFMVANNDVEAARVASGGLANIENVIGLLHPPKRILPEVEEEFVDPVDERAP